MSVFASADSIRAALVAFGHRLRVIVESIDVADPMTQNRLFDGAFAPWLHELYERRLVTREELVGMKVKVCHETLDDFLFEAIGPATSAINKAIAAALPGPQTGIHYPKPLYFEYTGDSYDDLSRPPGLETLRGRFDENVHRHVAEYKSMCDAGMVASGSLRDVAGALLELADRLQRWNGAWEALKALCADLS